MQTQTITYQDERCTAELVITEANMLDGMKRTRLSLEAQEAGETDTDRAVLRMFTYPALVASVRTAMLTLDGEAVAWPVDFETFLLLPEALGVQWEKATYALNPHWLLAGQDVEKKA